MLANKTNPPILLAFDFDHTIVDCNSDTWIYRALPPPHQLPPHIRSDTKMPPPMTLYEKISSSAYFL